MSGSPPGRFGCGPPPCPCAGSARLRREDAPTPTTAPAPVPVGGPCCSAWLRVLSGRGPSLGASAAARPRVRARRLRREDAPTPPRPAPGAALAGSLVKDPGSRIQGVPVAAAYLVAGSGLATRRAWSGRTVRRVLYLGSLWPGCADHSPGPGFDSVSEGGAIK